MPVEWWKRVDRDEVLEAVRGLVPHGGGLVLHGDDRSGRSQAMDLVEERLGELGVQSARAFGSYAQDALRGMLAEIWKQLSGPAKLETLPAYAAGVGMSVSQILQRVGEGIADMGAQPFGLLLDDIDIVRPLPAGAIALLRRELEQRPIVLVVSSDARASTDWDPLGGQVLRLRPFRQDEVRRCMLESPNLRERDVNELDSLLEQVCEGSTASAIEPNRTYVRLRTLDA